MAIKPIHLAGILVGWLMLAPAIAQEPQPYPDFTFRLVKPPAPGASKRITVQIESGPAAPVVAKVPDAPAPAPASGAYGWYWNVISPALSESGPGRLAPAVTALRGGPDGAQVATPRLQMMQGLAQSWGVEILKATVGTSVSPALVLAVMSIESRGKTAATSPRGATGLMQLMPATATRFGVTDINDPVQNIRGGVAYLDFLMHAFGGDPVIALAGYNAGEGAIRENNGVPPFSETRDYVPLVLAAWTVARGLCLTPPQLVSDGCVFAVSARG